MPLLYNPLNNKTPKPSRWILNIVCSYILIVMWKVCKSHRQKRFTQPKPTEEANGPRCHLHGSKPHKTKPKQSPNLLLPLNENVHNPSNLRENPSDRGVISLFRNTINKKGDDQGAFPLALNQTVAASIRPTLVPSPASWTSPAFRESFPTGSSWPMGLETRNRKGQHREPRTRQATSKKPRLSNPKSIEEDWSSRGRISWSELGVEPLPS